MTYVVGVDPGDTVGIFTVAVHAGPRFVYSAHQFSPASAHQFVKTRVRCELDAFVACEAYVITTRTARLTRQPTAIEVIGDIKQICREHDTPFALQMKSDAAKLARDTVLKQVGWWQPGMDHANDAARQAMLALTTLDPLALRVLLTSGSIVSTCR